MLGHELDMGWFFRENGVEVSFQTKPDELNVEMVDGPGKFINMGNKKADAWTERWMAGWTLSSGWLPLERNLRNSKGDLYVGVWI